MLTLYYEQLVVTRQSYCFLRPRVIRRMEAN